MKSPTLPAVARAFREIGRDFHTRGWVLGTSGNFSAVLTRKPLRLAITASSVSKGDIRPGDVLTVGVTAARVGNSGTRSRLRPSAETALHVAVVQSQGAGAVLHTHSVWSTMLSELHSAEHGLRFSGFEMLKGLEGVRTHEHAELEAWAEWATIPVINALTAEEHPCQALADALTMRDRLGSLAGVRVAWVGDGSNVCTSLCRYRTEMPSSA